MLLKLTAADKTDVGRQREQNEDAVYKRVESSDDGDRGLFIVADGMGGYKAGEVASKLAVEQISKFLDFFFKPVHDQPTIKLDKAALDPNKTIKLNTNVFNNNSQATTQKTQKLSETQATAVVEDQFVLAVQQANKAIIQYGEKKSSARGLGSTVTAVLIQNNHAFIANVGDSRTYLLRDNNLAPITRDHSLVARLVESKHIEPEDIYTHPQRNLIYRSLGAGHKNVDVDVFHQELRPGDKLLLCSDGLWEMIRHQELFKTVSEQASPQAICEKLITLANENGGEDNITAVVVHVSAH